MDIFSIGSAEQRTQLLKSAANVRQSFSGTSDRTHSDSSDFSALAKEMIRAAAEKKKELLSERSAFDQKTDSTSTMSSEEIKTAIEEIANSATKTAPSADSKAAESAAPVWKDGEKTAQQSISEMVKEQMEKIDSLFTENEYDKNHDKKLIDIRQKMRQGKTLSPSEQQYLASKDPDTYSSFQKIDTARKMFRCTLNSCRTKDDVISMRLSNALTALSEYRKAVRNGGSGDAVVGLNAAFENELRDFSKTSGYRKLPTVAECNKFDRDLAKARKFEREKRLEKRRLAAAKKYKKKKKAVKTPGDGKRTVAQVLADPTSRKVLASRAKRTYCTCPISYDIMSRRMNSKA